MQSRAFRGMHVILYRGYLARWSTGGNDEQCAITSGPTRTRADQY
jgi:hypothetical protein